LSEEKELEHCQSLFDILSMTSITVLRSRIQYLMVWQFSTFTYLTFNVDKKSNSWAGSNVIYWQLCSVYGSGSHFRVTLYFANNR